MEFYYANCLKQDRFEFSIIDSPVTIGRAKCSVKINSSIYSKKHTSVEYNSLSNCWNIVDGHKNKKSINEHGIYIIKKGF